MKTVWVKAHGGSNPSASANEKDTKKVSFFVGVDKIWFEDLVRPSYDGHSMMGKGIVAKAEIYPSASAKTT